MSSGRSSDDQGVAASAAGNAPPSPDRSSRNAASPDANKFYDPASPAAQFSSAQFWSGGAGVVDDDGNVSQPAAAAPAGGGGGAGDEDHTIEDGVPVDAAFRQDVVRAVKWQRAQDGKDWHCSNVNSATRNGDGSAALGLVLCSGDLCTMKNYTVGADGMVSAPAKAGGMFSGF